MRETPQVYQFDPNNRTGAGSAGSDAGRLAAASARTRRRAVIFRRRTTIRTAGAILAVLLLTGCHTAMVGC
jgi:hypothetical protein